MKISHITLFVLIIFSCSVTKKYKLNLKGVYYHHIDNSVYYEINILNDSILFITQIFKCDNLMDSLKKRTITASYEIISKTRLPIKIDKNIYSDFFTIKLLNHSKKIIDYPIVENDDNCNFLNLENRNDRVNYESKKYFSSYNNLNIMNFETAVMSYRSFDKTISFSLKRFSKNQDISQQGQP